MSMQMDIIRRNAERDADYCPYCGRCPGLVRMKKLMSMLWKCDCGAVHDAREPTLRTVRVLYNNRTVDGLIMTPQPSGCGRYEVWVETVAFGRLLVHERNILDYVDRRTAG